MSRHRVLVADDQPLFREGVARALAEIGRFEVMGSAASGAEAVDQAAGPGPEMIHPDLSMPQSGLGALDRIARHELPPVIVTLTVSEDSDAVLAALEEGAQGLSAEGIGGAELVAILDRPMAGESRVAPALAARMLIRMHRFRATPPDPLETVVRPPVSLPRPWFPPSSLPWAWAKAEDSTGALPGARSMVAGAAIAAPIKQHHRPRSCGAVRD
ncbi:response regulator transcription factor [Paracoccus sp. (in: a-proteobacteria)]|uniref:response regulator n=1 Tax=Paracoccus sp. TaxID=267 RepID=UPI0035B19D00